MQGVSPLLEVEDLKVTFKLDEGLLKAVDGVNIQVPHGRTLGLVGESGCGKSVAVQAVMRLTPPPGKIDGKILLQIERSGAQSTVDLAGLHPAGQEIRKIRGKDIAMIFQEPMTSFSPLYTIGNQIMEAILLHKTPNQREAREIAVAMLDKVGISNPTQRIDEYPHQLSGGMRQRAMIAMALSCDPSLLIADEPTTALDVTVQAQVMELMKSLQRQYGMAMLYITHDLGTARYIGREGRIVVLYLGTIVETGSLPDVIGHPRHPYLQALLSSVPVPDPEISRHRKKINLTDLEMPSIVNPPPGCRFHTRCPFAENRCKDEEPALRMVGTSEVACHLSEKVPVWTLA